MTFICLGCISDNQLRKLISPNASTAKCKYCENKASSVRIDYLAEIVDKFLRKYICIGDEIPVFEAGYDKPYFEEEGTSLIDLLQEELGIEYDIAEDLSAILIENDPADIPHGGEYFYDFEHKYERSLVSPLEYTENWETFCELIKHKSRFFDEDMKLLLEEILGKYDSNKTKQLPLLELGPETSKNFIFRARRVDSETEAKEIEADPAIELGPPSSDKASANRMNPAGISVFYGALSKKTAIAEVRPFVSSLVVVGKFKVIRKLKLLDLSQMGRGFTGSIFHSEYENKAARLQFFKEFHTLIAKPIQPNEEILEYIPTQAVAEYVSNILRLDGILYASAQLGAVPDENSENSSIYLENSQEEDLKKYNVVLFRNAAIIKLDEQDENTTKNNSFFPPSLSFVKDSVNVVKVKGVKYDYDEIYIPGPNEQLEF